MQHSLSLIICYFWTRNSVGLNAVFITVFSALHIPIETVPQEELRQVTEAWAGSIPGAEDGHWHSSRLFIQIILSPPQVAQPGKKGWTVIPSYKYKKFSLFSPFLYHQAVIFNSGEHIFHFYKINHFHSYYCFILTAVIITNYSSLLETLCLWSSFKMWSTCKQVQHRCSTP